MGLLITGNKKYYATYRIFIESGIIDIIYFDNGDRQHYVDGSEIGSNMGSVKTIKILGAYSNEQRRFVQV